nr:hypothetical protein CFP56_25513 [Quercus suber]
MMEIEARSNVGYRRAGLATDICALTSEDCQKICRYLEFISVSSYHKDAKGDPFQWYGEFIGIWILAKA